MRPSGAIASNLMAGIVGDTAAFQHPNATPRTLRVASELQTAGAPMADIARLLYRTKPNAQLHLFGIVLSRLDTASDGRLVWSTLEPADLVAAGAGLEHSEGIIDLLAQSSTAEVAILFRDMGDRTRISTRTREGGVDAIALTAAFGGGGHPAGSGCDRGAAHRACPCGRPGRGEPAHRHDAATSMTDRSRAGRSRRRPRRGQAHRTHVP